MPHQSRTVLSQSSPVPAVHLSGFCLLFLLQLSRMETWSHYWRRANTSYKGRMCPPCPLEPWQAMTGNRQLQVQHNTGRTWSSSQTWGLCTLPQKRPEIAQRKWKVWVGPHGVPQEQVWFLIWNPRIIRLTENRTSLFKSAGYTLAVLY